MRNWLSKFKWLSVYFSPFRPIIPKFTITQNFLGVPYYLPRKEVEYTIDDINQAIRKKISEKSSLPFKSIVRMNIGRKKFVDKKIGFDFVPLGWKTKWCEDDIRHEYSPIWSFVFFKWQFTIRFIPKHESHYWECWIFYRYYTDKSKSVEERLKQARKEFPCIWMSNEKTICYWHYILKKKYL